VTARDDDRDLARELRLWKGGLAAEANAEFFRRHPEWEVRHGERSRRRGEEDARQLLEFLAGAIDAGLASPFEDYARWTTRLLGARGIAAAAVAETFEIMGEVLRARHPPERAVVTDRYTSLARAACLAGPLDLESITAGEADRPRVSRDLFVEAILAGQRRPALAIALSALQDGARLVDIYADVLQESLYEVGRRWEVGAISVADEHMATAIVQFVLAHLFGRIQPAAPRGKALITGVAGELHQVGANIVADALEAEGWSVRFLGVNVPQDAILSAIDEHEPIVIGISATRLPSVSRVRELIEAIRARPGRPAPRILVGGGIFRQRPELASCVGADATAGDVRSAVERFAGRA